MINLKEKTDQPIGTVFEYDYMQVEIVHDIYCEECIFSNLCNQLITGIGSSIPLCWDVDREDLENVHFKQVI